MAWQQVEDLMLHWLIESGADTWHELTNIELEQGEINSKTCECGYCRRVNRAMNLELSDMYDAAASELLPEIRLRAVNISARRFTPWARFVAKRNETRSIS